MGANITMLFDPKEIYIEDKALDYYLGKKLHDHYSLTKKPIHIISEHHKIPELRNLPDEEFNNMKKLLIIGTRKSLKISDNERSADFIVPFTSSGCSARCLYCYLMCTFFTNSYLRIFVNRDDIWKSILRKSESLNNEAVFEIGSNSDMVLEDSITGNLQWAIEKFAYLKNGRATLATKFADIDPLLNLDHKGKTQIRISVNPKKYVGKIEIGTSILEKRIEAANKLCYAGYRVGINIAPVMLLEDWKTQYEQLFTQLAESLNKLVKDQLFMLTFLKYIKNHARGGILVCLHKLSKMKNQGSFGGILVYFYPKVA